jgi:hypothetical protein
VPYITKWFNKKLNHLNIVLKHNENAKKLELKEDPFSFFFLSAFPVRTFYTLKQFLLGT